MIPLVLLHGFLGSGASWRGVLAEPPLAGAEIFAPDLPGHRVAPPPGDFAGAVESLAAAIAGRFRRPVVLAGYSLGGRLALGLLHAFPRLFAAGLLIGAAPGLGGEERRRRAAEDAAAAARLRREGLAAFLAAWRALPLFASQARVPAPLLAEQEAINRGHDPQALAAALERLSPGLMPDYRPLLPEIETEIEILAGAEDAKFLALARQMENSLPHARLEVVPGAGHNLVLEAPAAVAAALAGLAGG